MQKHDLGQSAGEDSNSSDTEPSDRGDGQHDGTLDGMDNQRSHSFPNAFLGLQGIPGLLPGPSGLGGNDFGKYPDHFSYFVNIMEYLPLVYDLTVCFGSRTICV